MHTCTICTIDTVFHMLHNSEHTYLTMDQEIKINRRNLDVEPREIVYKDNIQAMSKVL